MKALKYDLVTNAQKSLKAVVILFYIVRRINDNYKLIKSYHISTDSLEKTSEFLNFL